jgi:uncharacterized protein Smg (DUF494 family)
MREFEPTTLAQFIRLFSVDEITYLTIASESVIAEFVQEQTALQLTEREMIAEAITESKVEHLATVEDQRTELTGDLDDLLN